MALTWFQASEYIACNTEEITMCIPAEDTSQTGRYISLRPTSDVAIHALPSHLPKTEARHQKARRRVLDLHSKLPISHE